MVAALHTDLDAAIALTRFSLGARPGELRAAAADPRGYLRAQIRVAGADQPVGALKSTPEIFADDERARLLKQTHEPANMQKYREILRGASQAEFLARAQLGAKTPTGFRERWALFWCNHFSVTRKGGHSEAVVGAFEREAIRPHVFGRFADLLLASMHHPTMLLYLDQAQSIGPNSPVGLLRRKIGLNENLARECMELHTLGVGAGYTQADVTEMARALTGWLVRDGRFFFAPNGHEPGVRQIFGRRYEQAGEAQATAALMDFAAHPRTARHLATKIARHFTADVPPPTLVAKLEAAYRDSGGRLDRVAAALVDAPEAWDPRAQKFKTPYEFVISSWRAAGAVPERFGEVGRPLRLLGQFVFHPPSPKGWDDEGENWAGAAAVMERLKWAGEFAAQFAPDGDTAARARDVLGARLTPASATAIARAETRNEAFALLLMTPEFQRR